MHCASTTAMQATTTIIMYILFATLATIPFA
jgi:hypothetical protein